MRNNKNSEIVLQSSIDNRQHVNAGLLITFVSSRNMLFESVNYYCYESIFLPY